MVLEPAIGDQGPNALPLRVRNSEVDIDDLDYKIHDSQKE
jgi:hypothetical protein